MVRRAAEKAKVQKTPTTPKKRGRPKLNASVVVNEEEKSVINEVETLDTHANVNVETLSPTRTSGGCLTPTRIKEGSLTPTKTLEVTATPTKMSEGGLTPTKMVEGIVTPTKIIVTETKMEEMNNKEICEKKRIRSPVIGDEHACNVSSIFVHISNLVRPFAVTELHELLKTCGEYDIGRDFWMNGIKSSCYIKFANLSQSHCCIEKLNGITWPDHNKKSLRVEYADMGEMYNETNNYFNADKPLSIDCGGVVQTKVEKKTEIMVEQPQETGVKSKAISELYRRTICEPHIYWLPNQRDEVTSKN